MLRRVLFALLCALALVGLTAGSASAGGPPPRRAPTALLGLGLPG